MPALTSVLSVIPIIVTKDSTHNTSLQAFCNLYLFSHLFRFCSPSFKIILNCYNSNIWSYRNIFYLLTCLNCNLNLKNNIIIVLDVLSKLCSTMTIETSLSHRFILEFTLAHIFLLQTASSSINLPIQMALFLVWLFEQFIYIFSLTKLLVWECELVKEMG